jgi:hypothetical protein
LSFFFLKALDIGNYRTEKGDQSYLDFVGHQPIEYTCVQDEKIEEMKEDFANSSGQLLNVDNFG